MHLSSLRRAWLVIPAALAAAVGMPVAPPEPEERRLGELIRQLGHEEFSKREAASKLLEEAGESALAAVREAAASNPDPEVRLRAVRVMRAILWTLRKSKSTGMDFAPVAAREFTMGSLAGESGRKPEETLHRVRLTRAFLIGLTEVTQEQYSKVMDATPSWFSPTGGGKERVANEDTRQFPVEQVTWFDAVEFCNRLGKLDGFEPYYKLTDVKKTNGSITGATVEVLGGNGYRLPTEAEWEHACRAGSAGAFHFGGYNTGKQANLKPGPDAGGYGGSPSWKPLDRTTRVGSYKASGWNLHDTHGNVAEWCGDWYDRDYYAKSPPNDPTGPKDGTQRVVRGGSWLVSELSCRSASRTGLTPGESNYYTGFRVARTP